MRLIGINISDNKRIEIALGYIYGIGQSSAGKILKEASIDVNKRTRDLNAEEVNKIQSILERTYKVEGELRQKIRQNINRLKEIKCYRGLRHLRRLPVRGQRTRTNSRTVRGNVRKTIGSGRRKVGLK
ncbi:30S ribosomal protein S13 [Candidatus Jorgensenbacteria bacterium CG_4_9_14_3_um_filter_38_10]|uniref:Small ribosomal subunit protein uS13 n=1 Tax=Candidatus Jorgensenbacteria bacterium CG11_big_fil_rev_8_21_14_0_20_38_23 TaxID=1974594 RepID=A0A2H0NAR4_9BACT|nr:MAG: 30S ribosomal protein S13 [Candidatus Jorgensenbacteria bacterium CG11_big_fil_rev_8_21_14_0_20_38_23]PJA94791.1 MAG: 30S ribosomal protein S13 [Candidatus Jorgensenbacteria bacterium CG_4_9_14_3_um_filter_38_10]